MGHKGGPLSMLQGLYYVLSRYLDPLGIVPPLFASYEATPRL